MDRLDPSISSSAEPLDPERRRLASRMAGQVGLARAIANRARPFTIRPLDGPPVTTSEAELEALGNPDWRALLDHHQQPQQECQL